MSTELAKSELNIVISSKPPPQYRITPTLLDDCICDPVFAAEFFFKEKLDEFQKVRLKISWWTPFVMDSSGFSSAKTRGLWVVANLRCLLMPDHLVGVYYQMFSSGQTTFWPYYTEFASKSQWFRQHIGKPRVIGLDGIAEEMGKAAKKGAACWTCDYKNGSQVAMPAPGFYQDAKGQAGRRLNDLYVDEWTKIMGAGSEGIDDQLIGRVTRHNFNKDHPLWCNHMMFLATAEDTMHPAYARYKAYDEEVKKGNPDYYLFSFSYKDYSDRPYKNGRTFKDVHRADKTIHNMRKSKSVSGFRQEGFGIWSVNGKGLYTSDMMDKAYQIGHDRGVEPMVSRHDDWEKDKEKLALVHYLGGIDPAKAETKKADDGSFVTLRVQPKIEKPSSNVEDWQADFVWAYRIRKADAGQWSGIIHRKHQQFHFTGFMMDGGPGGGGNWIRPELAKMDQNIKERAVKVRPIACQEDEASMTTGDFTLAMFKRGDHRVDQYYADIVLRGDDTLIDCAHKDFWEGFNNGVIGLPKRMRERDQRDLADWSDERRYALILLELGATQLTKIAVRTNEDGTIFYSGHNARLFSSKSKKDFGYAMLYAYLRFRIWLSRFQDEESDRLPQGSEALCG